MRGRNVMVYQGKHGNFRLTTYFHLSAKLIDRQSFCQIFRAFIPFAIERELPRPNGMMQKVQR